MNVVLLDATSTADLLKVLQSDRTIWRKRKLAWWEQHVLYLLQGPKLYTLMP